MHFHYGVGAMGLAAIFSLVVLAFNPLPWFLTAAVIILWGIAGFSGYQAIKFQRLIDRSLYDSAKPYSEQAMVQAAQRNKRPMRVSLGWFFLAAVFSFVAFLVPAVTSA